LRIHRVVWVFGLILYSGGFAMNEVIRVDGSGGAVATGRAVLLQLPTPGSLGVRVRDAVPGDLPFIDALQRKHAKAVGWMPTKQLEGHIARGHVVIAVEEDASSGAAPRCESGADRAHPHPSPLPEGEGARIGYCIGVDKYFKREDTGIIYQMNIAPGRQRELVGATLLKAMFERCPYGVKLFCCWCAQDLAANYFWEAMGFVPLAFRAGSRKRDRIHIFWQKRIREGDVQTEWWYPSQTGAGALKEDRLVLPIPPGTHWSDAKPRVLPGVAALLEDAAAKRKQLASDHGSVDQEARDRRRDARTAAKRQESEAKARAATVAVGGLRFAAAPETTSGAKHEDCEKKAKTAMKNDPRLIAAARELRDRWMEQVAAQPGLILPAPGSAKYEVSRAMGTGGDATSVEALPVGAGGGEPVRLLPAA
jgi:hypothetical protein